MRTTLDLTPRSDVSITSVTCRDDHARWSDAEVHDDYRVVLVRTGRFRRRASGSAADLDRTVGYVGVPGEEEHFAHPAGGDVCTAVSLAPSRWRQLAGDTCTAGGSTMYVDARLDLAHRRLLAAAQAGDLDHALDEELLTLLAPAVRQTVVGASPVHSPVSPHDRRLVAAARDAIHSGDPASHELFTLAESLEVSPYRLSRAFPRELGITLTHYRNRVRVGRAMDRLTEGDHGIATLAADLGFADQAHLCRTVRRHVGQTPTALRRLLRQSRVGDQPSLSRGGIHDVVGSTADGLPVAAPT